ncbi:MAG TPA: UDP-N-acetylmuramoyl-L-alanyl-D-glutamate--2,6-diaminopimelate ligase [Porphyromonadaceae bacterium]|nr:UDP-N-acetylmuramoyl-L-alanyl-D-glutamate--2,6-diaminopimelate ligase [Porphyromonadaceae bacterium]
MKLSVLIEAIKEKVIQGGLNIDIFGLDSDSRKIEKGHLFVAVKGTANDGHEYINKAIEQGATAVVCEDMPSQMEDSVTYIQVKDSADALGKLAAQWYGNPSDRLTLVGVTGTNGKTTIATLLYDLFRKLGYKTGLLSTVCNYVDDKAVPATHTTPDPISLNMLLAEMVEAGCTHAFMEVSSHSVDQKRISGLNFDGGIFTNLTRDHLDYHKTVDAYLKAKKGFFDQLPKSAFALTNLDDKSGMVMLQNTAARKLTYSLRSLADFKGRILEKLFEGTLLEVNGTEVMVHFVGKFNAYNLLAVYGAAVALGEDPNEVLLQISTLHPVSGRFETIRSDKGFTAIVDYAHTPDALTNVLNAIHEVLSDKGRVITVVGAGGNRDKGKRPLMAKESVKYSEQVILTSDNPRFEEPDAIIEDMTAGLDNNEMKKVLCITDRKQAIKTAVMMANAGDVILIAGKGHEDYQDVKGVKHHFDDREVVKEFI